MGILIAVSGRGEHGKSSVADSIVAHASHKGLYASSFELSSYILRHCIVKGLIASKTRKQLNKEEIQILVDVGDSTRQDDPTLWIRRAMEDVDKFKPDVALIPNLRKKCEADVIRKAGGTIIKVVSLNKNGSEFVSPTRDPNAELETEQYEIKPDFTLTTRRGEAKLLQSYARVLFDHLYSAQPKPEDTRQTEFDFVHA